jgi:hypothetical protein
VVVVVVVVVAIGMHIRFEVPCSIPNEDVSVHTPHPPPHTHNITQQHEKEKKRRSSNKGQQRQYFLLSSFLRMDRGFVFSTLYTQTKIKAKRSIKVTTLKVWRSRQATIQDNGQDENERTKEERTKEERTKEERTKKRDKMWVRVENSFHQNQNKRLIRKVKKVTTMNLTHINGCVPSPELLRRQVANIVWVAFLWIGKKGRVRFSFSFRVRIRVRVRVRVSVS